MKENKKWLHIVNSMQGGVGSVVKNLLENGINGYEQVILELPLTQNCFKRFFLKQRSVNLAISHLPKTSVLHFHTGLRAWIYGFKRRDLNKIATIHGILPTKGIARLTSRLDAFMLSISATKIIAVSEACKKDFINLSRKSNNYQVIYNGVYIRDEKTETKIRNKLPWTVIFVGGLWINKGVDIFLETAKLLRDRPIAFEIFGDGPEANLVKKVCKIYPHIKWFNNVNSRNEIFMGKNILLFPSLFEGCPMAILEAMAFGVTCVASDILSLKEIIENGRDGILVATRNPSDYASAIENLINNPNKMENMQILAKAKCKNKFSSAVMADNYLKMANRIVI
jgi:glycosyltransferase involved in cell wall biosynthesis